MQRMNFNLVLSVCSMLALGMLAAGCGGGDGETTATVSKKQFLTKVNKICSARENEKFNKVAVVAKEMKPEIENESMSQANLEDLTRRAVVPVFQKLIQELQQLDPPSKSSAQFEAIVAKFKADVAEMESDPGRFVDGTAFEDGNRAARAYGLSDCEF